MILIKCLILIDSCIKEEADESDKTDKADKEEVDEVDKAEADKKEAYEEVPLMRVGG